jgi:hypothetical protein
MENNTMRQICYDYLLFDRALVYAALRFRPIATHPDAYLSEDADGQIVALQQALAAGYRWVRTEGDFAILEKPHTIFRSPT